MNKRDLSTFSLRHFYLMVHTSVQFFLDVLIVPRWKVFGVETGGNTSA